jgi:hypothetical protein
MLRRRLLSIVGALGLVTGLITSGVAVHAASFSEADFQTMINNYLAQANSGQTFCFAQPASTTTCPTLTQTSVGSDNVAVCVEYDNTAAADQSCSITQANVSGNNIAIVIQIANRRGNDATQLATQNGTITQDDRTGDNFEAVLQLVRQSDGIAGSQTDHQFATMDQNSPATLAASFGRNFAVLGESSSQYGQSQGLPSSQSQFSEQDVSDATHHINQYSKGVSKAYPFQSQVQVLFGDGSQSQQIDPRCCSDQLDNAEDVFPINESAIQIARRNNGSKNTSALQFSQLDGLCHTNGHCTITQFASDNANTFGPATKDCAPGSFCTSTVTCVQGEGSFCGSGGFAPIRGTLTSLGRLTTSGRTSIS